MRIANPYRGVWGGAPNEVFYDYPFYTPMPDWFVRFGLLPGGTMRAGSR